MLKLIKIKNECVCAFVYFLKVSKKPFKSIPIPLKKKNIRSALSIGQTQFRLVVSLGMFIVLTSSEDRQPSTLLSARWGSRGSRMESDAHCLWFLKDDVRGQDNEIQEKRTRNSNNIFIFKKVCMCINKKLIRQIIKIYINNKTANK